MIHSIVSEYDIFANEFFSPKYKITDKAIVTLSESGRIVSFFSTDPAVYLDKRYSLGKTLK